MARPAKIVGFVPVGFLAIAVAAAIAAVTGGWSTKGQAAGYGIDAFVQNAAGGAAATPAR